MKFFQMIWCELTYEHITRHMWVMFSFNSLLLFVVDRVCSTVLLNDREITRWTIPVNMRGPLAHDPLMMANLSSKISVEIGTGATPADVHASVKRRLQAMQLIHPHGMGRIFRVLALSRNCRPHPVLAGLEDPFVRP